MLVSLSREVTNALNPAFITQLAHVIKEAKENTAVHGFVLTSANEKFFSIGLDIPYLYKLTRSDFMLFYRAFNRFCIDLYMLPMPTVAAITGHAVAGGCILALCCDYRYIADGKKKMGLNELKLGVPVPYPADRILHQRVGFRNACEITDTGDFFLPDALLRMGVVDEILPPGELKARAFDKVRLLNRQCQVSFAAIKRNRQESVAAGIMERLEEKEEEFVDCWFAEGTRARLREAMEKF